MNTNLNTQLFAKVSSLESRRQYLDTEASWLRADDQEMSL